MIPWNLIDLDRALRAGWAADTCSPDDQAEWQPGNPAWGHCDITALIVNDVFGGDLLVGEVHEYLLLRERVIKHLGSLPGPF